MIIVEVLINDDGSLCNGDTGADVGLGSKFILLVEPIKLANVRWEEDKCQELF